MYTRTKKMQSDFTYNINNAYVHIDIAFGIESFDRPNYNWWYPEENLGVARWDDNFELATSESRSALASFCERVRNTKCTLESCTGGNYVAVTGTLECVAEEFDAWHDKK